MFIGICRTDAYTNSSGPDVPCILSSANFLSIKKEANMKPTQPLVAQSAQPEAGAKQEFRIEHVTPAYWRVTIDHPPFNIFGPESIPQLNSVISQIENDPELKVVVFDSAVPGFF
jgi:Enoyl-CoA hydratase/carnithine racemase